MTASNDDLLKQYTQLKADVEKWERRKERAKGAYGQLIEQLHKLGCNTVEDAEALLEDEEELAQQEQKLAAGIAAFQKEYGSKLEE